MIIEISGRKLTPEAVAKVALSPAGKVRLVLSQDAVQRIKEARKYVDEIATKRNVPVIYGVNTGFGSLAYERVSLNYARLLQRYLITSSCVGVDGFYEREAVRAAMLVRANTLAMGYSGVRVDVVQTLLEMLNRGVTPLVPKKGSVGSGDLAPLAHIAIVFTKDPRKSVQVKEQMILEKLKKGKKIAEKEKKFLIKQSGEAFLDCDGTLKRMSGIEAMESAGIKRIVLEAKEGLSLVDGSSFSAGLACLAVYRAGTLIKASDKIASLSLEALKALETPFSDELITTRPHIGMIKTAKSIRNNLSSSSLVIHTDQIQNSDNVLKDFGKVQDATSLRCIPQVHGAVKDVFEFVRNKIKTEINSATDNPLIITKSIHKNKAYSGGNFHDEIVGFTMDFLAIAIAELASISERRIYRLLSREANQGLPPYLIDLKGKTKGLMSGAMLLQYVAASLVSQNKVLCHPGVVDSIPTSENIEDHVSMTPVSANKCLEVINNTEYTLAIELWCSVVALRLRQKKQEGKPSSLAKRIETIVSKIVPEFSEDRVLYDEIEELRRAINKL